MAQVPVISESEWRVMKVLWASSPLSAMEIITALADTALPSVMRKCVRMAATAA